MILIIWSLISVLNIIVFRFHIKKLKNNEKIIKAMKDTKHSTKNNFDFAFYSKLALIFLIPVVHIATLSSFILLAFKDEDIVVDKILEQIKKQ